MISHSIVMVANLISTGRLSGGGAAGHGRKGGESGEGIGAQPWASREYVTVRATSIIPAIIAHEE